MTKDTYFEMCEQMGVEPIEAEIPVDPSDFPELVETSMLIYTKLRDNWDGMSGRYLGKDYSLVPFLFNLYNVDNQEEQRLSMSFLQTMDTARTKIISDKVAAQTNSNKTRKPR